MDHTGTPPKEPSVDYGTLYNEGDNCSAKANKESYLHPRLKLLLTVTATLFVVAIIVILAVFGLSFGKESDNLVGSTTETGEAQLTSNLTDQERALAVLSRVPLIDGHSDFFELLDKRIQNKLETVDFSRNVTEQWGFSQTDIPRMRQGMLGAQLWAVSVSCLTQQTDALRMSLEMLDTIKRFVAKYNDTFTLVTTSQGILETFEKGKIASLISIEGGHSIDSSLATLRMLYDLGLRSLTLTHDCNTPWANGTGQLVDSSDQLQNLIPRHSGLTEFGKMVVKEMNRLGMIIDLTHTVDDTILDTLNATTAPIIFSHSAAWHLCNGHSVNINDNILQRVQSNNGIVMVNFATASLGCTLDHLTTSTLSSVADHIDWIKQVAGPDHVGIGGVYESGIYYKPNGTGIGFLNPMDMEGIEDVSRYPELFAELVSRGWKDEDLEKLAGRNFLRVFSAVEEERDRLSALMGPIEDLIPDADVGDLPCRSQ